MRHKGQFDTITTVEEAEAEIKEREGLLQQMVGWLYTSILNDEVDKLQEIKKGLTNEGSLHP